MNPVKNTRVVNSSSGGQVSAPAAAALDRRRIVYLTAALLFAYPTAATHLLDLAVAKDGTDAAGEHAAAELLGKGETKTVTAAGEVAVGNEVYVDLEGGEGKVKALPAQPAAGTYVLVGRARSAAAEAGLDISINDVGYPKVLTVAGA